jgi:curved DNA-binding protein CbpA
MGATQSRYDPSHLRIYKQILQLRSPQLRVQMIQQVLSGPEFIQAAKGAGLYASLLDYVRRVLAGDEGALLPGEKRSLVGAPSLPAPAPSQQQQQQQQQQLTTTDNEARRKAQDKFYVGLAILGLDSEQSLSEDALKAAYKRRALQTHPDKGGSKQAFDEVKAAYNYLLEILTRIKGVSGQGSRQTDKVEAPSRLTTSRSADAEEFKHVQPVRLNAQKLDMNTFNKMFEENRLAEPDEDGYGDWLKDAQAEGATANKYSGDYNRDRFMRAFEDDVTKGAQKGHGQTTPIHPAEMALPVAGAGYTELGRERPADYTAAANDGLQYTDLRMAYTRDNTITNHVANVRVESRSLEQYKSAREDAPKVSDAEKAALMAAEKEFERKEALRQRRAAQESVAASDYFDRMKQRMIIDK